MSQKDLIKKVIEFKDPARIGWDFNSPKESDIYSLSIPLMDTPWGREPQLQKEVAWFNGELKKDPFGNIWGRLGKDNRGECIKGCLQDGWEKLADYDLPVIKNEWFQSLKEVVKKVNHKFIIAGLPGMPFSIMRTMRGMENFLADVMLEEAFILTLGERVADFLEEIIAGYGEIGVDAVMFWEDWGTQTSLLISPKIWRRIFKPWFQRISKKANDYDLRLIMHSCGYIYEIMEDLIELKIDALQLDQPALFGIDRLSAEFGGRIAFYSPVDIQKTMQTGNKKLIQEEARQMIKMLGKFNGGFIAKDYPNWEDIEVKNEWAEWAREVFISEGYY